MFGSGIKGARGYHDTWSRIRTLYTMAVVSTTGILVIISAARRSWRHWSTRESISGLSDWKTIKPDRHHDWIAQRSDAFAHLYPMGSKEAKAGIRQMMRY